ncbi:hypothetical protein GE061_015100 [Apolygus lucorum]|uniref:CHK kinase-like domain-containing protein n=1 Tax=Apolygus lucorum TaxID=248454 RepID=A0A8S9XK45_APOLU|nr:hypothetical protein GE061_015100 [Apolygus lucorum]
MTEQDHGLDTQLLARFLKKRFHEEKPVEVISVDAANAAPKGNNYASLVRRVKMVCLTASGKKKCFSIIVKNELQGEGSKEAMVWPVFRVETEMYTTILPMMEDLMEEFGDKREKLWPDLLGFRRYNMIAFKDLSEEGYEGVERRNSLDFNHSKLVLRALSRIHAMSKVLLERGMITEASKGKIGIASEDPTMNKWWHCLLTVVPDAMLNSWGDEWKELAGKLRNQESVIMRNMVSLCEQYDKRFEVLNHGDPWMTNMLFKYMEFEDNFPVSIRLVDYQMFHLNSFIWDLAYFLITSTIPTVRRTRLHELFEVYQVSLEKNLNFFNYKGYVPTLEDVKSEWERTQYGHLGFSMFQPMMTAETSSAFDMEKITTHPPHEVVDESVFNDGKALRSIGEDLKNFDLLGLL